MTYIANIVIMRIYIYILYKLFLSFCCRVLNKSGVWSLHGIACGLVPCPTQGQETSSFSSGLLCVHWPSSTHILSRHIQPSTLCASPHHCSSSASYALVGQLLFSRNPANTAATRQSRTKPEEIWSLFRGT